MAADLARTPTSGIRVQVCGDVHLLNFGVYKTAERSLVFDINDFDETLPGPWEWDVKRLAASLVVAGRDSGFGRKHRASAVLAAVGRYRTAMAEFAATRTNLQAVSALTRVVGGRLAFVYRPPLVEPLENLLPDGGRPRDFYVRQLRDGKGSVDITKMVPEGLTA
jgi:hypothetical protein